MKPIRKKYTINASIEEVWKSLVNSSYIEKWGGGPAKMNDKVGTKFKLWGGDIYGKNIEIVPDKKLVQEWYSGAWAQPSILTITLTKAKNKTRVVLKQTNVPKEEYDDIEKGWDEYYFEPIKELLEG